MKNTKPKVRLWSVLTGLTAILTVAAIVGNIIANQYATTINVALNASTYKIIHGENTGDTEYFKKGFASDEEREAYEAELCATVEAEGAALLKNENNALPLASGAKVSLFGHGSVDLMYGGTGSGSVDTSKAPNLKQALEAQGITINQTLWDLYSSDSMMSKYSRMTPLPSLILWRRTPSTLSTRLPGALCPALSPVLLSTATLRSWSSPAPAVRAQTFPAARMAPATAGSPARRATATTSLCPLKRSSCCRT